MCPVGSAMVDGRRDTWVPPHKEYRRTGLSIGAAICFVAIAGAGAYAAGFSGCGAGPSSGSLEMRVRYSRRKHSSDTIKENTSAMG